jgi:hypothetical protein
LGDLQVNGGAGSSTIPQRYSITSNAVVDGNESSDSFHTERGCDNGILLRKMTPKCSDA